MTGSQDVYEVSPCKDKRGVDLISDALPFGRLCYAEPNAIGYAKFYNRSHDAGIRVYDAARATRSKRTSTRARSKNCERSDTKSRRALKRGGFSTS
jgi:hypothetical protein